MRLRATLSALILLSFVACQNSSVGNGSGDRDREAVDDGTAYSKARRLADEQNLDNESARHLCIGTVLMEGYDQELQYEQLERCVRAYPPN